MQTVRGSHIHRVHLVASTIFGHGFAQEWFLSKYDRNSLPEFQKLLGVTATPGGKKYPLLPLILYPNGSLDKNALFLNPVLAKVRTFIYSRDLLGSAILPPSRVPKQNPRTLYVVRTYLSFVSNQFPPRFRTYLPRTVHHLISPSSLPFTC